MSDRSSNDPISPCASPSLASTSSEAFRYSSAVYREPLTKKEMAQRDKISENLHSEFWGDERQRKEQEERSEQERKALRDLAMHGWTMCEIYEENALGLAKRRAAEDSSRNTLAEGYAPTWAENDQRALESLRQKEDYVQLAEMLSVFLASDEESEKVEVLRYRLRNLKGLLRIYDSQWLESSSRLQKDENIRKQRIWNLTEKGDHDSEEQGTCHDALSGGDQKNRPVANESLCPINSSNISKAPQVKGRLRRETNISPKTSSCGLPLSSGVDAAETQPSRVTLRRSKRLIPPVQSVAKDSTRTASTDPSKRVVQSKPERKVAGNLTTSPAKPQGISKRQSSRLHRGRQGKNK